MKPCSAGEGNIGSQLHDSTCARVIAFGFSQRESSGRSLFEKAINCFRGSAFGVADSLYPGSGKWGYTPDVDAKPRSIIVAQSDRVIDNRGVRCGLAETRWADQPQLAGLKLLARTEQVLAAGEAAMAGWDDAIMLDARERVISSSRGNIVIVSGGKVLTPDLSRSGIAGTRRQLLIDFILPSLVLRRLQSEGR